MADYNFRWGDDVQPYILQLASEYIEALLDYCHAQIAMIMERRDARFTCVVALMPNTNVKRVLRAKVVHRFPMLGFDFELRESPRTKRAVKPEFVLNFTVLPDFEPKDMPARLKRVNGKALSARPRRRGAHPACVTPAHAQAPPREAGEKPRVITITYTLPDFSLWISRELAKQRSFLESKLYKMYGLYQRLSVHAAVMWRRRPQLGAPFRSMKFLTPLDDSWTIASACARLEPVLLGESIRLMLFSFVSREQALWDADLFGRAPDEGERILA
jgi:hypothetical protein